MKDLNTLQQTWGEYSGDFYTRSVHSYFNEMDDQRHVGKYTMKVTAI